MSLLNSGNAKTRKGEKMGWITFGLHLAPFNLSGYNVCKDASAGCAAACLNTAGRGAMSTVQKARIAKTQKFFTDREAFMTDLFSEIRAAIKKAEKKGMNPCFRLNLTSDLPWEKIKLNGQTVFQAFPDVIFYDYTKSAERMTAFLSSKTRPQTWAGNMAWVAQGGWDWPKNYHLTFSRSESNGEIALSFLNSGGNVATVFRDSIPSHYAGFDVVDGDETDLRFLDGEGKIVGLREKGLAKKDETGFVLEHF